MTIKNLILANEQKRKHKQTVVSFRLLFTKQVGFL